MPFNISALRLHVRMKLLYTRECKFQGKFDGEMVAMVLSRRLVARCEIELDLWFQGNLPCESDFTIVP